MTDPEPGRALHFALPGDIAAIMVQVEAIEAFLAERGCDAAAAQQIALVAEEILTNIAQNAWAGAAPGQCAVTLTVTTRTSGLHVRLRTEDDGIPFDPLAAEAPDLEAALDDRPIGGLGIHLIRTMTDRQHYHRANGRNVLEVEKDCPRAGPGADGA